MRLSFVGSTGWSGSTEASRLPLPWASRIRAVQPCDFSSSPVSSNSFVFSQPTTGPPPEVHSVRLASSANIRWWVLKQVLMWVSFWVLGSYTARWRPDRASGNSFADGWLDPALQNGGASGGRPGEGGHTRARPSDNGVWPWLL